MDDIPGRIERRKIEILHVEKTAKFFPDLAEQVLFVQGGTEGAANFVEDVELFRAARGLLNQIAVLDRHADLVSESEKQTQFGGSEAAAIRRAKQQEAECLLLGLEADHHQAAQAMFDGEFTKTADGFVLFERREVVVTQITKTQQAAQARNQSYKIVIEALILRRPAEFLRKTRGNDGSRAAWIAMMEEHGPRGKANHSQHAIERLGQHALNFAANEARGSQVEIGQSEHIALDPSLFLFVNGHYLKHGNERGRNAGNGQDGVPES